MYYSVWLSLSLSAYGARGQTHKKKKVRKNKNRGIQPIFEIPSVGNPGQLSGICLVLFEFNLPDTQNG
jgi:hypothetical protein